MVRVMGRVRPGLPLASRVDIAELLDGGRLTPSEVAANLRDLARLNRLPGGTAASIAGIARLVGAERDVRVLDVGTGRADMPLAFAVRGWATVAVDTNPEVLAVARRLTAGRAAVTVAGADARSLPYDDGEFDVAHCSLLLHHLDPPAAVVALRELSRVSRRGVVVNDLRRGIFPLLATALSVATCGRVTRADGIASARRAYTLGELDTLLSDAGLRTAWRSSRWWPRVVTVAQPA